MKVLLTGSRGFTGPYVRAMLEHAGHTVVGGVFDPLPDQALADDEVLLDIVDRDACRRIVDALRPDVIVHLAGIAFAAEQRVDPYYRVNVAGTEHLLRACLDVGHRPHKIVLVSSSMVYGTPAPDRIELDESAPLAPANHYAISKVAMEMIARTYFDRLPILIARPFNYIGRGQGIQFVTAKIVDHFVRRAPVIELGNIDVARDFSDVRDIAQAYVGLVESDAAGEVVNLCSGRAYPLQYVLDTLRAITGHAIEVRVNPAFVRANDPKLVRGSTERLDRLIGARTLHHIDATLEWMVEAEPRIARLAPLPAVA
ncbi:NAD-dependent epimerase/dehydratase family protein [Pararobbsia silviterrae]|uniref:NAD-dependent epimerase/dehydratase family protein n=1 Tax=Pararobbsia silviterrae TaxID=1792498 RepID=A0A494Y9P6_9BURK|nr:NAD-dependent epimerase/dehydratase family protein [Pararobbsia silviterrae]RKP59076.1 NAD-dependent epimerase/dehydratase family protein [Pararobbsia silviterrae]